MGIWGHPIVSPFPTSLNPRSWFAGSKVPYQLGGSMSEQFRNNLRRFNRKERFYVVQEATRGGFDLDDTFRRRLEEKLGITIPAQAVFMAMDYHLDWIYASLFLCGHDDEVKGKVFERDRDLIQASHEDVDLLIASPDVLNPAMTNLIMIEAKGDTSWTNSQAESKAIRLRTIFQPGTFERILKPHYLIWSPNPSINLRFDCFPQWALKDGEVQHLKLTMGEELRKVTCCNMEGANQLNGNYWKVDNTGR